MTHKDEYGSIEGAQDKHRSNELFEAVRTVYENSLSSCLPTQMFWELRGGGYYFSFSQINEFLSYLPQVENGTFLIPVL